MRLALLLRRLRDPVGAKGQPPAPVPVRTVEVRCATATVT